MAMNIIVPVRRFGMEGLGAEDERSGGARGGSSLARSRSMRKPRGGSVVRSGLKGSEQAEVEIMMLFGEMSRWIIPPASTRDLWPGYQSRWG